MRYINIAYDYEYDNNDVLLDMGTVDIVLVPDFVCDRLDEIVQKFFDWCDEEVRLAEKSRYPEFWVQDKAGDWCMSVGTEHFIRWLNERYFDCEQQKSELIKKDTEYEPKYPTALF